MPRSQRPKCTIQGPASRVPASRVQHPESCVHSRTSRFQRLGSSVQSLGIPVCPQEIKPALVLVQLMDLKSRYNNHSLLLHSKGYKYCTEFSKYIWSLKQSNTEFSFMRCMKKALPYECCSWKCDLHLAEKVAIA